MFGANIKGPVANKSHGQGPSAQVLPIIDVVGLIQLLLRSGGYREGIGVGPRASLIGSLQN